MTQRFLLLFAVLLGMSCKTEITHEDCANVGRRYNALCDTGSSWAGRATDLCIFASEHVCEDEALAYYSCLDNDFDNLGGVFCGEDLFRRACAPELDALLDCTPDCDAVYGHLQRCGFVRPDTPELFCEGVQHTNLTACRQCIRTHGTNSCGSCTERCGLPVLEVPACWYVYQEFSSCFSDNQGFTQTGFCNALGDRNLDFCRVCLLDRGCECFTEPVCNLQ